MVWRLFSETLNGALLAAVIGDEDCNPLADTRPAEGDEIQVLVYRRKGKPDPEGPGQVKGGVPLPADDFANRRNRIVLVQFRLVVIG